MLNVLVLRHGDAAGTPVAAEVTASMQNLAGVRRDISLREVSGFHITALPAGAQPDSLIKLSYRQRMWRY